MQEFVRAVVFILALVLPLLAGQFMSPAIVPWLTALSALLGLGVVVTWAPLTAELRRFHRLLTVGIVSIVAAIVVGGLFALASRWADAQLTLPLDLTVTGIQSGPWPVYPTPPARGEVRPMPGGKRIILTPVLITNRSQTNRVSLRFQFQATLKGKSKATAMMINEHDGRPAVPPTDVPNPLLGTLDIGPERTAEGSLSFYVSNLMPFFGEVTYDPHVRANTLLVTDLISGKSREFKVPTSMGGTVINIPE